MQDTELPALDDYVALRDLLPAVASTFPTQDSLKWWIRQNRDALAQSGALIAVTGRLRFHPARFKLAAVEIGRNAALLRLRRLPPQE